MTGMELLVVVGIGMAIAYGWFLARLSEEPNDEDEE